MTPEDAAKLRAPFPPEAIGKLPRVICANCSKSPSKVCAEHSKQKCPECGNYMTTRHIHLDYVGHAGVRDRLLQADPDWTWEPAAVDATGMPLCTEGGLWIRLTVCGVTRYGWGDGPDIKQRISDAIRNAAMSFGVALDLWSKEDLSHEHSGGESTDRVAAKVQRPAADAQTSPDTSKNAEVGVGGSQRDASATSTGSPSATPRPNPFVPERVSKNDRTSKSRRDKLKSRCVALQAEHVSVADARAQWNLPKVDDSDDKQLIIWEEMLRDLEAALEAPFEAVAK